MTIDKKKYLLFFIIMLIFGLFLHVFHDNKYIDAFLSTKYSKERTIQIIVRSKIKKDVYFIPADYTYMDMLEKYKIRLKTDYSGDIQAKLVDGEEYITAD